MEQTGKRHGRKIETVCPACGMPKSEWPDTGVVSFGTEYCCHGCADGIGCTCKTDTKRKIGNQRHKKFMALARS